MGRKAKLKKTRQETPASSQPPKPTQFVKQMERQGLQFGKIQHSPELPNDHPEPQV